MGNVIIRLHCKVCGHEALAPEPLAVAARNGVDQRSVVDILRRVRCTRCDARGLAELKLPPSRPSPVRKERFVGAGLDVVSDPKYHMPDCKWVERMNVNEIVEFRSRVEAEFRGYRRCKVCQP